jgi:hypothetical protein
LASPLGQPAGAMAGGCHGGSMPMPSPAHRCCFAAHQIPAIAPVARVLMALAAFSGGETVACVPDLYVGMSTPVPPIDASPPLATVLRI